MFPPPPQCLNAVRTVQSLACLEEADHTVGFLLQLSSFRKEWHFHLPQLMRDVQVRPETSFLEGASGRTGQGVKGRPVPGTWLFSLVAQVWVYLISSAAKFSLHSIGQPHRVRTWALA